MEDRGGGPGEGACSVARPSRVKPLPGPALPLLASAATALAYLAFQGEGLALLALSLAAAMMAVDAAVLARSSEALASSRLVRCASGGRELIHASLELEAPGLEGSLEVREEPWTRLVERQPLVAGWGGWFRASYTVRAAPGLSESRSSRVLWTSGFGLVALEALYEARALAPVKPRREPAGPPLVESGVEAAGVRGGGVELWTVREWTPWDDARRIHWSASARAGRLRAWEPLPEAGARIHVFVDLSRPAWLRRPGSTLADRAMRLASGIALAVASSGGIMGFTVYTGAGWVTRPPGPAREALAALEEVLAWSRPEDAAAPGPSASRALAEAARLAEAAAARLLVIASPALCERVKEAGLTGSVVLGCGVLEA